ncbi:MAG: hypothetical protein ACYC63_17730 [Armatimonadota bacterium]
MRILKSGGFHRIVELVPARPDIQASRYLSHEGEVLEHVEISPVPFLCETLLSPEPLIPAADNVVLVGGQLNSTGGGCLNVAFDHLVRYLSRQGTSSTIRLPMRAAYSNENSRGWRDPLWTQQVAEDLAQKMACAGIAFELSLDDRCLSSHLVPGPRMKVFLDTHRGGP